MSAQKKLKGWHVKNTGQKMVKYQPLTADLTVEKDHYHMNVRGMDFREKYRLEARLYCEFVCADAEYNLAYENACMQILGELYNDVLKNLYYARTLITAGESDAAIRVISEAIDIAHGNEVDNEN